MADFVTVWKALSIVLTGAFGILGLLTEYRDKETNKITRWGRIALIGILVSSFGGVVAQILESSDNARKALELSTKTQITVTNIERLLNPIGSMDFEMKFRVSCAVARYAQSCQSLSGSRDTVPMTGEFSVLVGFIKKGTKLTRGSYLETFPDLRYSVSPAQAMLSKIGKERTIADLDINGLGSVNASNGEIRSQVDLKGATMKVEFLDANPQIQSIDTFDIHFSDGQLADIDEKNFTRSGDDYLYVFGDSVTVH